MEVPSVRMLSSREAANLSVALGALFISFAIATYLTDGRIDVLRVIFGIGGVMSGAAWRLHAR
jgi:hypothetical protein